MRLCAERMFDQGHFKVKVRVQNKHYFVLSIFFEPLFLNQTSFEMVRQTGYRYINSSTAWPNMTTLHRNDHCVTLYQNSKTGDV